MKTVVSCCEHSALYQSQLLLFFNCSKINSFQAGLPKDGIPWNSENSMHPKACLAQTTALHITWQIYFESIFQKKLVIWPEKDKIPLGMPEPLIVPYLVLWIYAFVSSFFHQDILKPGSVLELGCFDCKPHLSLMYICLQFLLLIKKAFPLLWFLRRGKVCLVQMFSQVTVTTWDSGVGSQVPVNHTSVPAGLSNVHSRCLTAVFSFSQRASLLCQARV